MNGRWWVVGFCVVPLGAAVLSAPRFRPSAPPQVYSPGPREWYARSINSLRAADSRSISDALIAAHVRDTAHFIFSPAPNVPEKIANHLRESLQQTAEKLPRVDSAIQTLATIVVDTGETVAGVRLDHMAFSPNWFSIDAFIPDSAAPRPTCTVVLRLHAGLFRNTKSNHDGLPASLVFGPCAWYSTYGVPGRGVAQWLDSTGYLATSTRWPYGGSEYGGFEYAMLPSQEHGPHERWDNMIAMYGPAGTRLAACAAGRPNACTNYMLAAQSAVAVSARRASEARGRITLGRGPGTNYSDALLEIMMARMERDLGPARFDQFWKSNLSVPAAFAAASGEPLEDWVRRHLIAMTAPYHAGPLPGETVLLISALAALMLLSFGVYEVGKRGRF